MFPTPQSRRLLGLALAAWCASGCRCGPQEPTPVTLRLKNSSRELLFVDDSDGGLGLTLQRSVGGKWVSFAEEPPCSCLDCEAVCRGCSCKLTPAAMVRRVDAGETLERVWNGLVHLQTVTSCGRLIGGPACLRREMPPVDERFRLQLCYSLSDPDFQAPDGGSVAPGSLPSQSLICVGREFRPQDGVVEVSPERGATCTAHSDCKGSGELCFSDACTTACPANDFPQLGAAWQLRVAEPDDQGFFTRAVSGGLTTYEGAGTISSVSYQNGTMTLRLSRTGSTGEVLRGALYLTLPPPHAVALAPGTGVSVKLIDASTAQDPDNRGLVLRELDGGLLAAADSAQLGKVLGLEDLRPFSVAGTDRPLGCQYESCGKRLYFATTFSTSAASAEVEPGKSATLPAQGKAFRLLNVTNYSYRSGSCRPSSLAPFAILREEEAP